MTVFLLFAETLAGRVVEVDSSTCDSVRCVKDKIQEKTGKSWEYQTLTSAGYELENERLVREFNTNKSLRFISPSARIGGNTFGIVVNPSDSITSVKEMIFQKEGIPVEEQEFMFAGQATNDYAALRAHMDRESMRHVVLHLRAVGRIHVGKISEFGCPLNITVQPSWTMKDLSEEGVDTDGEQKLTALTGGKHTIVPAAVRFTGKVRIAMSDMPNEMASVEFDYTDTLADVKLFYGKDVLTGDGTIGDHIPGGELSIDGVELEDEYPLSKWLDADCSFPYFIDIGNILKLVLQLGSFGTRIKGMSRFLYYNGVEMEDERTLGSYNTDDKFVMNLSRSLRGGIPPTATAAGVQQHIRRSGSTATGPEVAYQDAAHFAGYQTFELPEPLPLDHHPGNPLKGARVAFETWGQLNDRRDNAVLLHTGLSASSHAKSTAAIPAPGWWESFIGPGHALDTDKFFIICTNVLGSCFGSTGPSSVNPDTSRPYGGDFPVITIFDMVRMQAGARPDGAAASHVETKVCVISDTIRLLPTWRVISSSAYSSPHSIALRHVQRQALVSDPHWQGEATTMTPLTFLRKVCVWQGKSPRPRKEAAKATPEISIFTADFLACDSYNLRYRSGPEWDSRFARRRSSVCADVEGRRVSLEDPVFAIEEYIRHQGKKWVGTYDPNSLLYLSKAMDMFTVAPDGGTIADGLKPMRGVPTMVIGVKSDILFPVHQQRELADALREVGNNAVVYYELSAIFGHDTFLVDTTNVVPAVKGHLEFH
ncbi:hypothetical protein FOZ60_004062 [Perkinsus olseni]|uniref:Ubiquitin-like domain-containing protein n=1 Tax=Perkinsus olseni TaxID=32597 RepID=A0A7J6PII7_PEROL|nr:hypothetical protein FOZ60_004062 [Perkinsus olseni]